MQRIELAHGFLVECLGRRRLVKIQIATEQLVRAFAGQHHFHAHGLDAPRQQVHRCGGADGGDVVGFDVPDHFGQRIKALPKRVDEAVMHGAQRVRGDLRGGEIRRAVQPDRERVQTRPPCLAAVIVFNAFAGELCGTCGHQRGIQTAGQQHAVRHVRHQLSMHCLLERFPQYRRSDLVAARVAIVAPRLVVVTLQLPAGAVVEMPGRERRHVGADADQRLHLRRDARAPYPIMPPVQRAYTKRIAGDQITLRCAVPQRERENAIEFVDEVGSGMVAVGIGSAAFAI